MSTDTATTAAECALARIRETIDGWSSSDQSERKVCMDFASDLLDSCRYDRLSAEEAIAALITGLDVLADEARSCLSDVRAIGQSDHGAVIEAVRRTSASRDVRIEDDAQIQQHGDTWVQAWIRVPS
jgi:hypothetical protein